MRSKKTFYFVWMLVIVLLVCVGCGKKPAPSNDENIVEPQKDGQKELVEKAIKEIAKNMKADGGRATEKKVQRSLAQHILKDHTALMAHFQSQKFDKMADVMGPKAKVYKEKDANGNPVWYEGEMSTFWCELYQGKQAACEGYVSIELEIYAADILLEDIVPKEDEEDCKSTEDFIFRIIALDEKGNVICNQGGGGTKDRRHTRVCPWI